VGIGFPAGSVRTKSDDAAAILMRGPMHCWRGSNLVRQQLTAKILYTWFPRIRTFPQLIQLFIGLEKVSFICKPVSAQNILWPVFVSNGILTVTCHRRSSNRSKGMVDVDQCVLGIEDEI